MTGGDYSAYIAGHTLEYFDDGHIYLVDGIEAPSISRILSHKFGGKYRHVSPDTLQKAADAGTAVHMAVERYCRTGEESELPELRGFKFLQKHYGFRVLANEVPVILFLDSIPAAVGRLDMVLEIDGKIGGADIKRTSTLDKEYLAYQLNLYRIAYRQCYGIEWEFLKGIHLRENTRRFVDIPIAEELALGLVKSYQEGTA